MKTYFISGHRDISAIEFINHYISKISGTLNDNPRFVVGDYEGVDTEAQKYLLTLVKQNLISHNAVTVYHMFDSPRVNVGDFNTVGGFKTDCERDSAMTSISDADIAWVRQGKKGSGTHQNILRRGSKLTKFVVEGTVTFGCKSEVYAKDKEEAQQLFDNQVSNFAFSTIGNPICNVFVRTEP